MNTFKFYILGATCLAISSTDAFAQTWICDSKAAAGFDRKSSYEIIRYSADASYRIKVGIDENSISSSYLRGNSIFSDAEDSGRHPASIEKIGIGFVALCEMHDTMKRIFCNYPMPFGTNFDFSLETGQYTMLAGGYEDGGASWVEVGECRKIN
jgi:hypothetical protein